MLRWFNPRVVLIILSVLLMLEVTRSPTPELFIRRAVYCCGAMIVLYIAAFVFPLRKAVKGSSLIGLACLLIAAWGSLGVALIADALQTPQQGFNWPRTAFVLAAGVAFYLFFDHASKGFEARNEMRITGRAPWRSVPHPATTRSAMDPAEDIIQTNDVTPVPQASPRPVSRGVEYIRETPPNGVPIYPAPPSRPAPAVRPTPEVQVIREIVVNDD